MNTIIAKIDGGLSLNVIKADYKESLNTIPTFTVEVLYQDVINQDLYLKDISLIVNGQEFVSGYINKTGSVKISPKEIMSIKLDCEQELGRLTCYRALGDSHFQDVAVTTIITNLLSMTGGDWVLSLNNMLDSTITTTIDLRGKKRLFDQIIETVKAVPDVHIRYGGINGSGKYVLEIGNFNSINYSATQGANLVDVQRDIPAKRCLKSIEAIGDFSSDVLITLEDALDDARTTAHADYSTFPISLDATSGTYICTNSGVTNGCSERIKFPAHKTKNDVAPTLAEVAEAGYALWLKTVRELKSNEDYEKYKVEALLSSKPEVGDRLKITSRVREPVIDPFGAIKYLETFSVNADYRIISVSTKFAFGDLLAGTFKNINEYDILYDIELTTNDEAEEVDPDILMFESLERFDSEDSGNKAITTFAIQQTALTYNTVADSADSACLPNTAKEYVIEQPSPPVGATSVSTNYSVVPATSSVTVTVSPSSIGQDWEGCVEQAGGGWSAPAQDITVTVNWQFS